MFLIYAFKMSVFIRYLKYQCSHFYRFKAEREPLLSSFLYASILAHSCFERSLGFVLANRLKNATLLATQLMDVFDDVFMIDTNIQQAIRLDVQVIFFSLNLIVKKHLFGAAYALGFLTCHRL